jgi:hypothetical protein
MKGICEVTGYISVDAVKENSDYVIFWLEDPSNNEVIGVLNYFLNEAERLSIHIAS